MRDKALHALKQRELQRKYRDSHNALKESLPCVDCGMYWPFYVTEWDHVPSRGKKLFNIAPLASTHPLTNVKLQEELAKCDLVCGNCHNIRTHERTV